MNRTINFYAINPKQTPRPFPKPIDLANARALNDQGWDIYWTFNEFVQFGKRTKQDLKKIWAFYCEVDGITKEEILTKLKNNLYPSLMIKSFNGFHLYWYLKDPIDCSDNPIKWADWYHEFVKTRFLEVFDADPQACDACRLLRAPFYRYWKQQKDGSFPAGDFYIDIVYDNEDKKYTLSQIEICFPKKKEVTPIFVFTKRENHPKGDFWSKANAIPVLDALKKLSGTPHVSMERFDFKKQKDILRIYVNGKSSNAWIDKNGLIGSTAGAAPAIPNWLYYYHKDWKKVAEIIKEVFNVSEK